MKTIGILGGMPAASTQLYDQELCRLTQVRLGGLHSPDLLIRSLDFTPIEALQIQGDWNQAGQILNYEARALKRGRAEMLILATNTMHKLVQPMMQGVSIPLLHIADATAGAIVAAGKSRPGLMATAFTMGQSFTPTPCARWTLFPWSRNSRIATAPIASFMRSCAKAWSRRKADRLM